MAQTNRPRPSPSSLKARQIEAAARAMWARDWFVDPDDERMRDGAPTRPAENPRWDDEPRSVKQSYRDAALRALTAAAAVRERETSQ